jgi:hypothetical protein
MFAVAVACGGCTNSAAPNETCTTAICPTGGHSYKFCSAANAASCRYIGSDNKTFACKSCSDCASAATQVASWCGPGNTTTGSTGSTTGSTGSTTGSSGSTGSTTGQPLTGCNGLLMCYIDCSQGGGAQSCYDDCDAGATQLALDLLNDYGSCIDSNCFQAIDNDSGMPYCSDATIDSPACDACYTRILGSGGACIGAQMSCINNKP